MFVWFGANAIALYMINHIVGFQELASKLVGGNVYKFLNEHVINGAGAFVNVMVALALATALARYLYQREIFLRV